MGVPNRGLCPFGYAPRKILEYKMINFKKLASNIVMVFINNENTIYCRNGNSIKVRGKLFTACMSPREQAIELTKYGKYKGILSQHDAVLIR